jgi:hypothetical protein
MVTEAQEDGSKKTPHLDILSFCPCCFATDEDGSWNHTVENGYCMNCGANGAVQIPRYAVDSIRNQASWVGKRYYPNEEDREQHAELKRLRALPRAFPGRSARQDPFDKYSYYVTQQLPGGKSIASTFKANSHEDAIEASRFSLPYVTEEELRDGR